MKYLEEAALTLINNVLNHCQIGDRYLLGSLDAYSCKQTTLDKKVSKNLQTFYTNEAHGHDNSTLSPCSIGSLNDISTRKLLINLIATMNATFPDYDFSTIGPDHFQHVSEKRMRSTVNAQLSEMVEVHRNGFLEQLWKALESVIRPYECQIYSYLPDVEADPLSEGTLWSFNYFLYNKTLKKILFFKCTSQR